MKRSFYALLLGLAMLSALIVSACSGQQKKTYQQAYELAKSHGDVVAAINATYMQLASDTSNVNLRDTLCRLYTLSGRWNSAEQFGQDVLNARPKDTTTLQRVAKAQQNLQKYEQSLEKYQKLMGMQQEPNYVYQIAVNQYYLKRYNEVSRSINQLMGMQAASDKKIPVIFSQNGQTMRQNVPIKAAAHNLMGVVMLQNEQKDAAKQRFQQALNAFPRFQLAFNNLAQVDKKAAQQYKQQLKQQAQQQGLGQRGGMQRGGQRGGGQRGGGQGAPFQQGQGRQQQQQRGAPAPAAPGGQR
jgi:tetratricopeptide (TPR) repeat protein